MHDPRDMNLGFTFWLSTFFFFIQDRYEMFEGDFRQPEAFKQPTMAEGSRYRIADIYHLQVDPEVVLHVGIIPGWRVRKFWCTKKNVTQQRLQFQGTCGDG